MKSREKGLVGDAHRATGRGGLIGAVPSGGSLVGGRAGSRESGSPLEGGHHVSSEGTRCASRQ